MIYRASLAEMFIPYGDPNPTHYRKNVFDMGEYGIGVLANSLELGCDCLGEIATRHLWVTAYDPGQQFPAGEYPNQHPGGDGLPAWTAADRPLENTDLVLWHTFTARHVVRPEDWPVMPVTRVGFQLRADGFFDGNPTPLRAARLMRLDLR